MKRVALFALVVALLVGCAQASESSLQDVVDGRATAEEYVRAVVTDVRSVDEVLVELSSGDVTIWVTGFAERPGRGTEIWTAILGEPVPNDFVGLTYPSAGPLDPPEVGITDVGVVGVLIGSLAGLALLVAAVSAGLLRMRPHRRCPSCRGSCRAGWVTCAHCGHPLIVARPAVANPTVFSSRKDEPAAPAEALPEASEPDEGEPVRSTRIFHRSK